MIKGGLKYSFTFRNTRNDIVKNYTLEEGLEMMQRYVSEEEFHALSIFCTDENRHFQRKSAAVWTFRVEEVGEVISVSRTHDHQKVRKVTSESKRYLHDLKLTDVEGKVYKNAQDKWKQINHYIELLSASLQELPLRPVLNVVDMGAGKGYLTFALYDYLTSVLHQQVAVEGVEFREDLVAKCNGFAEKSDFKGLKFSQGSIEDYAPQGGKIDVLIALHACDTATDDAIFKGIQYQSDLIVVAPCCHKQVRRELEHHRPENDLQFMTKYGVFLERHAEMLTDGIRTLILEYYGYSTKVMEFVSDAHTPKNVLIVATKKKINPKRQEEIKTKIAEMKSYFGIGYHHLERLVGLN